LPKDFPPRSTVYGYFWEWLQIPTKSPAYSDFNARTIPILIRPPFRDIPTHFRGLADEQS
jgi:hypothetical protein